MTDIAPGFTRITGTRAPPKSWGTELYIQLRCGVVSKEPYPVATCVWLHTGSGGDIIAVRKVEG
jgi:hypothetical protein